MGLQEHYVSSAKAAAWVAWIAAGALLAAGWAVVILAPDHKMIGGMLAVSASIVAVGAGVLHVRMYTVRVCALIRRTSGLSSVDDGAKVHAFN